VVVGAGVKEGSRVILDPQVDLAEGRNVALGANPPETW
jgi:hypothetical protein